MNTVEVTNPEHALADSSFYRPYRPYETEADLIAAALPSGDVHLAEMFSLKFVNGEDCGAKGGCFICDTDNDPEMAKATFHGIRFFQDKALEAFGVKWDPDIRL